MTTSPPSHPWHPIPPSPTNSTCTVHLLQAGTLRIPYALTLLPLPSSPPPPTTHFPVPDYCFLITHPPSQTTYLFDLAMRCDLSSLPPSIVKNTLPNFPASPKNPATILREYGTKEQQPENVKAIIFSHTHFDHVGDGGKKDFPDAELWLGPTACTYARPGWPVDAKGVVLSENFPLEGRTIVERVIPDDELRLTHDPRVGQVAQGKKNGLYTNVQIKEESWLPLGPFTHTVDIFSDGSLYLIDAPGHAPGHQMALIRVTAGRDGEEDSFILLAGDCYHHPELLRDPGRTARPPWTEGAMHAVPEVAVDVMWRARECAVRGEIWVVGAHDFSVGEGMGWGDREVEGLVGVNEWRGRGWKRFEV